MRRIALLVLLSLALPLVLALTGGDADARARARIDADFIARLHERHGHAELIRGNGTMGHTREQYRREARRLREYLVQIERQRRREALVRRWQGVANCESGGNWAINTGNGHYGGLQFSLGTWRAFGGPGMPHQQPSWIQAEVADRVRVDSGLGHWPHCGRHYG